MDTQHLRIIANPFRIRKNKEILKRNDIKIIEKQ